MDSNSEARLSKVYPILASKIRILAEKLLEEGIEIRVVQGLRTYQEQGDLYAKGRTAPGPKVTDAPPGYSWHNMGVAVDVCPGISGEDPWAPDWNAAHPAWKQIWTIGTGLGLVSGALWKGIPDKPHFQLANIGPVDAPDDELRKIIATGGVQAVWKEIERRINESNLHT